MRHASPQVIVVVFGDQIEPGLARSALKHRWPIFDGRAPGVVRQIMFARAKAIVGQIPEASAASSAATGMLCRLARHWVPMVLLAVASYAANNTEAAVRIAGCDVFLPGPVATEQLDSTMELLLPGATADAGVSNEVVDHPTTEAEGRREIGG